MFMTVCMMLLSLSGGVVMAEPSEPGAAVTAQARFDRSIARVAGWVAHDLEEAEAPAPAVVVLGFEDFAERTAGMPGAEPGLAGAWDQNRGEVLINADAFAAMGRAFTNAGFFEDDAAGVLLAQLLTHAVHERRLGALIRPDAIPEDEREAATVNRAMRHGHALLVRHRYARWVDGANLEKLSRGLTDSADMPPGVRAAAAGEQFLARAHERAGMAGVWAALAKPPATMAALVEGTSSGPPTAASIVALLADSVGPGEWAEVTRDGVAQAVGQSWRWLDAGARAEVEAGLQDAFLAVVVDRGAERPVMLSVGVLRFRTAEAATAAPETLKEAIALTASRFEYTMTGAKRDPTPTERDGLGGWRVVSGEHPMPGGAFGFGVFGYRVIGTHLVLVNGVGVPADEAAVSPMLEKIVSWLLAS